MLGDALLMVANAFPDTPEGVLYFAVISQCVKDGIQPEYKNFRGAKHKNSVAAYWRRSALRYLRGPMFHAEMCGVEADYIRRLLKKGGFDVFQTE
ncbi:MAG: hypothetical protein OEW37_07805 [Rhodospirillaceae bacterium]|nr:hypothetical protein [Rhodospirillaceae bacterium]